MGIVNDIINEAESKIDNLLKSNEANIAKSLNKLEKKLINLYQAGFPKEKAFEIAEAQKLQKQLVKVMQKEYGVLINSINKDYSKIGKIIESEFKALELPFEFNINDNKLLSALRKTAANQFKQFGSLTENKMSQSLYDNVAGGGNFSTLIKEMSAALIGSASISGVPLSSYARTFAHDSLMGYYRTIQKNQAKTAGIKTFLYYGDTMGATRKFCRDKVGKIFDEKTINAWQSDKWQGKAPGSVWIHCGGYNCRHHLMPVLPEWIDDKKLVISKSSDKPIKKIKPIRSTLIS